MPEIILAGCTPEPLMNYLKALGVLRLVSEQADHSARGCWRNDAFVLQGKLDRSALTEFFLKKYEPTPIVGPWAGGSGFFSKDNKKSVNALANSTSGRCQQYRDTIASVQRLLKVSRIKDKPTKEQKARLLRAYRAQLPEAAVLWMDSALILKNEGQVFAPLLGTGGNDGRLDFSQNFMGRIVQLGFQESVPAGNARSWLENSLFASVVEGLPNAAVGQFSPGRAGGPNATQGMEGDATDNPWDFVLMVEGSLILGGAAVRRLAAHTDSRAAFPFSVRAANVGYASESEGDLASSRGELWLPLWDHPAQLAELRRLFGEGRADVARRSAGNGVDFARAVVSLGVDRGIEQFVRLSFLRRSGKAYLATLVGRFPVHHQRSVDLLAEVDPWLDRFRFASSDKNAPARFKAALRATDQAIFDFCRYGGPAFLQKILGALGSAERELAGGECFRSEKRVPPLSGLSSEWITAANDGSSEFELALALAGIFDPQRRVGPLRSNLEPIAVGHCRGGQVMTRWDETSRSVVWRPTNLYANFARVLAQRMMDGERQGCQYLPLGASNFVSLEAVSQFLADDLDDSRIGDLIWGLVTVKQKTGLIVGKRADVSVLPLPRAYALLKLLFLPERLQINDLPIHIRPESEILALLEAGRCGEACRTAARRLRASGLAPLPHARSGGAARDGDWEELDQLNLDGRRLAGALLLPLARASVGQLLRLVVREPKVEAQTL